MKKLLVTLLFVITSSVIFAQKAPYNVVMDVTSGDSLLHEAVMRWVHEIIDNHPEAKLEVVFLR